MSEDVHDSNCAPSTNEECDVAGQPDTPLSSANTLMRLCILPSGEIGQGGRRVWEGEAPCLAAQCNTGRLCVEGLEPAIALHVVNLLYKYSQEKRRERLSQCFLRGKYDSLLSV